MPVTPSLVPTPGAPPTYNPSMADTFSWVPVEGAGRPLFARATYLANASDISVSLSAGNVNVDMSSTNSRINTTNSFLSAQLGQSGFVAIQGGQTASGNFTTVQVISTCRISSIAANNSTTTVLTNFDLPTGFVFNGPITSVTLSYGAAIVYKL